MDKANLFTEDNDFNICKSWICGSTDGATWSLSEWFSKKVAECPVGVDRVKYDCETDGIFSCEEWEEAVGWDYDFFRIFHLKVDDPKVDAVALAMVIRLNAYVEKVNKRIADLREEF